MMSLASRASDRILLGSAALCVGLGTVHGFSVFLAPLEAQLSRGRGTISLTYSFALVAITAAVLFGPRIYGRTSPRRLVLAVGAVSAGGAVLAGSAGSLLQLWLGYSLLFGLANGVGYGFSLQFSAQVSPGREGFAMGVVTAAYALGAAVSPVCFEWALARGGFGAAMWGLAGALVLVSAGAAVAYGPARAQFPSRAQAPPSEARVLPLWLVYGAGVLAGLMAIGHAAGIAQANAPQAAAWLAPAVLAVCNLGGSLLGGRLVDSLAPRRLLSALPALSTAALLAVALLPGAWPVFLGLGAIGFAYGGIIAAYPAVIAKQVGPAASADVYGRVFTAWGSAGLAGPWLAGALFDATGGYLVALLLAALVAAASAFGAGRVLR